jgi:hypothetical protein
MFVRCIAVVMACVLGMRVAPAHAGNVETLIDQLKNGDSSKVRQAAALNLAKLGDAKAVLPLAGALVNDSDADVRAASAVGLGKLVNASTKSVVRKLVIANLTQAAGNDSSDFVKKQAQNALAAITGNATTTSGNTTNGNTSVGGAGGVYVNVGPMSSKTGSSDDKRRALMVKTVQTTLASKAAHLSTTWPGGVPSATALTQSNVAAFYIDGTLTALTMKPSGGGSTISCKVSMLLAEFPSKNIFGLLSGGASVTAGSSAADQDGASNDCVQAVIENLIANKIVPTICSKVSGTCP